MILAFWLNLSPHLVTSDKQLTQINLSSLQRIERIEKSFAYLNKMPWGYANYDSERTTLGPSLAHYSRPLLRLDLKTPQNIIFPTLSCKFYIFNVPLSPVISISTCLQSSFICDVCALIQSPLLC